MPVRAAPVPAGGRRARSSSGSTAPALTGGGDVDPALYGQAAPPEVSATVDRRRDDFELALVREALARDRAGCSLSVGAIRC